MTENKKISPGFTIILKDSVKILDRFSVLREQINYLNLFLIDFEDIKQKVLDFTTHTPKTTETSSEKETKK
jgi:hypothetical protein